MKFLKDKEGDYDKVKIWIFILTVLFLINALFMIIMPKYNVWSQRLAGQSVLAHAQYSREVAVAEAKAKMEAATLLAQAEVERAKGVAEANKIIGESLKQNEDYLRYLWITDVCGSNVDKTVVYVPTETNLPILEANRFQKTKSADDK